MNSTNKKTISIYWRHLKKYKVSFFTTVISIIFGVISNLIPPILYKEFFDVLASNTSKIDVVSELTHILFLVITVYAIGWFFWRLAEFVTSYYQTKTMGDISVTCYKYMHKHAFAFFDNNFVGSLVKRLNRFYTSFERIVDKITWDLIPLITNLVIITAVLFTQSPVIGFVLIIWVIVFILVNYWYSLFKLKYDIKRSEKDTRVTGILADSITNQSNIKLFSSFNRESAYFEKETKEMQHLRRFTWDLGHIMNGVQTLLMIGLEFGVMYFAIKLYGEGKITLGAFVLIQSYLLTIFHRLWEFGRIIRDMYEAFADAAEMTEILETPHTITDSRSAYELVAKKGMIHFDDVYFNYHKTRSVIKKFNLKIKAGERVAFVGPSGAGKSTLVKLLLRIIDTSRGKISIDDQNIKKVTQDSLHSAIAMVPQDPILFHRSLKENIRYARPDATDEDVIAASRAAHCHEFIESFPDQYETLVGERGVKLSGGERQRVAIARAILKNAPILVLDEATSSLDSESEALIQDALETLMKNKTVIVIAHRLSTIMKMDNIIVVDEGQIAEKGTHEKLLKKKNGIYQKLWSYQAGGFLE